MHACVRVCTHEWMQYVCVRVYVMYMHACVHECTFAYMCASTIGAQITITFTTHLPAISFLNAKVLYLRLFYDYLFSVQFSMESLGQQLL